MSLILQDWLKHAHAKLKENGVSTARLDCLVLLEDATGKDRGWLLAHPLAPLAQLLAQGPSRCTIEELEAQLARRARHEPLAYIRGKAEFYGRVFNVDKRVLQPRPESETMIDLAKQLVHRHGPGAPQRVHIVDVGCGSGALGITAGLEMPNSTIELLDIDENCLEVASANLSLHKLTAQISKSDLLSKMKRNPDLILANLPYVPDAHTINEAAMHEPRHAIFGGLDGLDLYRQLFSQLSYMIEKPGFVLTESLPPQHKELTAIAKVAGYKCLKSNDFIQVFTAA